MLQVVAIKKANELANNHVQNTLDISGKETNNSLNFLPELKEMTRSSVKHITFGQLKINFLWNNFFSAKELFSQNLDLLIIYETKLDNSSSNG